MSENIKDDNQDAGLKQEERPEGGEAMGGAGKPDLDGIPLPKVTFSTFLLSLASSALVQLGEVPSPESGKKEENLLMAKHSIDIINMLQDKIEKGLDDEEKRLLDGVLYELRMKYVIKSR